MKKNPQPAKKSYFFEKGYIDLKNTISNAWSMNKNSINRYINNLSIKRDNAGIKIIMIIVNILAIISVVVFGSIITFATVSYTHLILYHNKHQQALTKS